MKPSLCLQTSPTLAFAVAILGTAGALGLRYLLHPMLDERSPMMTFVLSVTLAGYVGGLVPGLFATWLGVAVGRFFFVHPLYSFSVPDVKSQGSILFFVLIGVLISLLATGARQAQQLALRLQLQGKEQTLREIALEEKAVQDERQRLSRELHDSVSQALYGIGLGTRTALAQMERNPEALEQTLRYILSLAESGLAEMRALVRELRPELLESEGLAVAVSQQAQTMAARHGLECVLEVNEPQLSPTNKHGLYRVALEALHNVVKHAGARTLSVRLSGTPSRVLLEVEDDGRGFDSESDFPGHYGIRTMRERVARMGGTLTFSVREGRGCIVRVELPPGSG